MTPLDPRRIVRAASARFGAVPLVAAIWLALVEAALAQPPGQAAPAGKSGSDWLLPYLLVLLCVALGLLVALRPTNRSDPEGGGTKWFSFGAPQAEQPTRPGEPRRRQPHRGTQCLVLSLIGLACPIFGFIALSRSKADLAAMKAGRMDRSGEGTTKTALTISLVDLALWAIILVGVVIWLIVSMAS